MGPYRLYTVYTVYGHIPVYTVYGHIPVYTLYTGLYTAIPVYVHTLYLAYIGVYPDLGPVPVLARPWPNRPNSMPNMRIFGYIRLRAHTRI